MTQALGLKTGSKPQCLLCGQPGHPHLSNLTDRLFGVAGAWDLSRCQACGLVWMDPMPLPEEIGKAYQRYYTHAEDDPQSRSASRAPYLRRKWRRAYRWLLRRLGVMEARSRIQGMFLEGRPKGRVLEVGCGAGERLLQLAADGWRAEGQEVDPQAGHRVRSRSDIQVHVGTLEALSLPAAAYDCILMNHVIEHLHDPVGLLEECLRLLTPGGLLVVVTPNIESLGARTFGVSWRGLEPPRHLYLYGRDTLRQLALRTGYAEVESFTSVAHAELLAIQSFDLQARGTTVMGEEPSWPLERKAMAFQLREAWAHRTDPSVGEEAVLLARKGSSGR